MSRTTKAVQSLRDLIETPTEPDDEQPDDSAVRAPGAAPKRIAPKAPAPGRSAPSAPPAFFIDEPPVVETAPVEAEPAVPPVPDDDLGRLRGLLDRAGDPVPAPGVAATAGPQRAGRGPGGRWRNDPHPLGRIVAVLVVLALVGACVAVGIRVLG